MELEEYKISVGYNLIFAIFHQDVHGKLNAAQLTQVETLDPKLFQSVALQEIFIELQKFVIDKKSIIPSALYVILKNKLANRPILNTVIELVLEMASDDVGSEYLAGRFQYLLDSFLSSDATIIAAGKIQADAMMANEALAKGKKELREWVEEQSGFFTIKNCYEDFKAVSKQEKNIIRMQLARFVKDGIIEKHPSESGKYRKYEKQLDRIDIYAVQENFVEVKWPFEIEKLYRAMPKNIVIIAGCPDSGKTAFCLDFVRLNIARHEICYFSSEMGATELRDRLSKFPGVSLETWKTCDFYERSNNFADIIEPDKINIIDFMEICSDAWKVGEYIKAIHDKLKNGICIIAIQKKIGQELGRGAEFSLEKARLYLSMDRGSAKIIKCKNWVNSQISPVGLEIDYKLIAGCVFRPAPLGWIKKER